MTTGARLGRSTLRARGTLVVAVCAGLTLAGCGGGSSDGADHPASASSSAAATTGSPTGSPTSATPSPVIETAPPLPPATRGKAGRKRFARHVMDLWAYALRTDDARPLVALGPGKRPCEGCARFASSLAQRRKQGWSVDLPGLTVHTVRVQTIGGQSNATATVDIPQSDSYNSDGSYRNTSAAHRGATFQVRMRYTKSGYQLLSFTVA
jgi:hypothetical protein